MSGFGSFLRSAPLALFGSAAGKVHDLGRVDRMVRTSLPLSRRVGFVQLGGGSGASSTAGYVANLLAIRRGGPVLGIDASAGDAGLLWHAGLPVTVAQRSSARRAAARRASDAVDGLPRAASGLWAMSLAGTRVGGAPASVDSWFDACSPITRFFDIVITDWGVRDARNDLAAVAAASHVLCIVARADRHAAEEAAAIVDAVRSVDRPPAVVVALVDVGSTGGSAPRIVSRSTDVPLATIPYDAARASEHQVASASLATRTRLAYGALAHDLVLSAVRTGDPVERPVPVQPTVRAARPSAERATKAARPVPAGRAR